MIKAPRLERKKRIKDQNAERKGKRRMADFPKTPEEFDRQMEGFMQIAFGLLKVAGVDPQKLIEKASRKRKSEEEIQPINDLIN